MSKRKIMVVAGAASLLLALLATLVYQIPAIHSRLAWRIEVARIYVKNVIHPVGNVPTAIPSGASTLEPASIASPTITITPDLADTPIPATPTLAPPPA